MTERAKQINFHVGPVLFHFSWLLPRGRGPSFYRTRGANFLFFGHPLGFVQIPWFWCHAAIEARGFDKGFCAANQMRQHGTAPDGRPIANCVEHPHGDHEWACLTCLGVAE